MKHFLLCIFGLICLSAYSQDTSIYVSDAGNFNTPPWQIIKYNSSGENPQPFITDELGWPQDILFLEHLDVVLISNLTTGKITRYASNTGSYIDDFATGISGPTRTKIGPDSLIYVLQWNGNGKVLRYEMDGTFVDEFTDVGVPQSIGLDWDDSSNLYVSSYNNDYVRKFDINGIDQGLFVSTDLLGPTNIWFDAAGDLLVSDYNGTAVKRFDSGGNYVSDYLNGLSNSEGVALMADSSILIGNGVTSSVKHYDKFGNYIEDLVLSGTGGLMTPNAVVLRIESSVGLQENSSTENGIVRIIDLMGRETEFQYNTPLIYLYENGTVKRVFEVED